MTHAAPESSFRFGSTSPKPALPAAPSGTAIPLGSVFGVRVTADASVFIIFMLVFLSLGNGVFKRLHPDWPASLSWGLAFTAAVLFFISILVHELSHALVGKAFGIRVLGITLFIFGGVAQIEDEAPHPVAEFLMAAAGPVTSIVIGIASTALGLTLAGDVLGAFQRDPEAAIGHLGPVSALLLWLGPVNLTLAVFNLIPGFPLDGGRVLRAILWRATGDLQRATRIATNIGQVVGYALVGLGILMALGFRLPLLGVGLGAGLWLGLIGWFLANAARTHYAQLLTREALAGVPVSRLMSVTFASVAPDLTVESLVQDSMMRTEQRCFPISRDTELLGLVCLDDVRKIAHQRWSTTAVSEIMTPRDQLVTVTPSDSAAQALRLMTTRDVDQLPVCELGELRGLVRRQDVLKWVSLQTNAQPG